MRNVETLNQELRAVLNAGTQLLESFEQLLALASVAPNQLTELSKASLLDVISRITPIQETVQSLITEVENTTGSGPAGVNSNYPRSSNSTNPSCHREPPLFLHHSQEGPTHQSPLSTWAGFRDRDGEPMFPPNI